MAVRLKSAQDVEGIVIVIVTVLQVLAVIANLSHSMRQTVFFFECSIAGKVPAKKYLRVAATDPVTFRSCVNRADHMTATAAFLSLMFKTEALALNSQEQQILVDKTIMSTPSLENFQKIEINQSRVYRTGEE